MLLGAPFFILLGALYIFFAFHEPPEAIAHFFRVPVIAVFFPPERRVKLGRLTLGVLLVFLGPICALLPAGGLGGSILGTVVAIVVGGAWMAARWKHAGEVSDADDAERRAQWQSFEILKRDPRFLYLQQYLHAKGHRTTFERAADPLTYRVAYIALWDARGQRPLAQQGAPAQQLVAYLERDAAPKRLHACLDFPTGACTDTEAGWMGWSGMVPLQPIKA